MTPSQQDDRLAEDERLAKAMYDRVIRSTVCAGDHDKFVAIAYDVDDFEIDRSDYAAIKRVLARHPGARGWLMRANGDNVGRIGSMK